MKRGDLTNEFEGYYLNIHNIIIKKRAALVGEGILTENPFNWASDNESMLYGKMIFLENQYSDLWIEGEAETDKEKRSALYERFRGEVRTWAKTVLAIYTAYAEERKKNPAGKETLFPEWVQPDLPKAPQLEMGL